MQGFLWDFKNAYLSNFDAFVFWLLEITEDFTSYAILCLIAEELCKRVPHWQI